VATLADRLAACGLSLPTPPRPGGSYEPVVVDGTLAHVSGQIALRDGALVATGIVGDSVDVETGRECARVCALNALAVLAAALDDRELTRVARVLKVMVFVASAPGFDQQPAIANAGSELFVTAFGDAGRHARSAVGVSALPRGTPVELDAIVRLR
jgi:enamine deaminase RidA (YjgF/YER057c/UK114 family)